MSHSREIRPHAFEIKFVVPADLGVRIQRWARTHLDPDPHGSGPFGDQYRTASVYFDNDTLDVFHRRGSYGRSKYRIRRYGDEGLVFLERKMRQPAVLAKRRTCTPIAHLEQLTRADVDEAWAGHWFHRRVLARKLGPACQVTYARTARSVVRDGENVRLTLDVELAVQPVDGIGFASGEGIPILDDRMILELKYRGVLPAIFRRLVEEFALTPQVASKYRLGRAALGALDPRPLQSNGAEASYA
ncbi:MAG TPA: polyphosphate polymerase domain-containing protein [Vicinamibacterales bacterium]|nr:polyphosphate polymerase domain-containing protein [Vicinamibacterales bacterium]